MVLWRQITASVHYGRLQRFVSLPWFRHFVIISDDENIGGMCGIAYHTHGVCA